MKKGMYTELDCRGVTRDHASACLELLGGKLQGGRLKLPFPMSGPVVRSVLGVLWRGVALRGGK